MVFNSWIFLVFFVGVYLLYLKLPHRGQNILLLVAGWVFYGFWDPRFLLLLWASTIVDYSIGLALDHSKDPKPRKLLIISSIVVNLGFLGFFKYCDFFILSTASLLNHLGFSVSLHTLGIIVPVGISFYTFQSIAYTVGVYRKEIEVCKNLLTYAVYVSFFPQLVAGPIERPKRLIVQVANPRLITWEFVRSGCWLILKGYFLKVYVADNLVKMIDPVFSLQNTSGAATLLAIYAFAFQIYGDFAGYTNIARGISRLMGFDLMVNFRSPYLSTNPKEFWQRWHISLSSWLRDYLYIPLGGNRIHSLRTYFNLMLTMLLGGLWHGAAWTYVIWGGYQGLLLGLHRFKVEHLHFQNLHVPKFIKILFFFHGVCLGWVLFRSTSLSILPIFFHNVIFNFAWSSGLTWQVAAMICLIGPVIGLDLLEEYQADPNRIWTNQWPALRYSIYLIMFLLIYILGSRGGAPFIYFQF